MEKKLDGNYTRMLRAILNKSWRQHHTKQRLFGHLPPITKTIKIRRTKLCWRSRDELISDVLLWIPSHGRAKAERSARTDSSVLIRDVALMTSRKQWTIGRSGERRSGISVLIAWHDDDDRLCKFFILKLCYILGDNFFVIYYSVFCLFIVIHWSTKKKLKWYRRTKHLFFF